MRRLKRARLPGAQLKGRAQLGVELAATELVLEDATGAWDIPYECVMVVE